MRSGSATELSAYTYQRAIKLTSLGKAPVLVAPVTVRVPLKRPRAAETDHTNQTRQTVASPLLHRGSRPRFPSSNRPLQPCQDTRCIAWLGRGFGFATYGILNCFQRFSSSSGGTSSTCVAIHQMFPQGSFTPPYRSPLGNVMMGNTETPPASSACR